MKKAFFLVAFLFSLTVSAQNEQLAQNYFDKGDFEKALISYQELLVQQPSNGYYFQRLIESYQQLQQYDKAAKAIQERYDRYRQGQLLVELGYNFHLQKDEDKAKKYYDQAIDAIRKNPNEVFGIAAVFERRVLLDYALNAYKLGKELEPKFNFNYQVALLYGQLGNSEMMISTFLDEAYANPNSMVMIQNQLSRFMTEEVDVNFNDSLRKALLLRAQKGQDIFWNQFLSWYFVQQKDYAKAFIQEKAIYKRNPETFSNIVNLGQLAITEGEEETAKEILGFVLENTNDLELLVQAHYYLMDMRIKNAQEKDYKAIEADLQKLLDEFMVSQYSLKLQILQAQFLTFNLNNPEKAKSILKEALELNLSKFERADVKMELADIFLYEEKFNQALLNYSQIEEDLKNDAVGHEASLKSAKTSYFKGDFEWAQKQFQELKSASSELIANDAMQYFLLISDNTAADSTQVALKKFARADYLLYKNKTGEALAAFKKILVEDKGNEIEAATMLKIGQTEEKLGNYPAALAQYEAIIEQHAEGIYTDEALYFSGQLYEKKLADPEKAKSRYEKIIFEHQDSIYFTDARNAFRQLRGDKNT
ncbi:Tetratricopeptide repeat protein [Flavobacterium longum]|uniref:tetratricopeptide repeat protein n=1 Tax=Flavobacterium longum TaxID=1299340 RepID=UPI0039E96276